VLERSGSGFGVDEDGSSEERQREVFEVAVEEKRRKGIWKLYSPPNIWNLEFGNGNIYTFEVSVE
jgi:hypothetical protein